MHAYDTLFFEEFKQLEQLCQQIYNQTHSVTTYIDAMEAAPQNVWQNIPNWKDDYYKLKHCRYIRNQLAHDTTSNSTPLSTADDLAFLQNFIQRLRERKDPLALANIPRPAEQVPQQPEQPTIQIETPTYVPPSTPYTPPTPPRKMTLFDKFVNHPTAVPIGCGCFLPIIILIILGIIGFGIMAWGWFPDA